MIDDIEDIPDRTPAVGTQTQDSAPKYLDFGDGVLLNDNSGYQPRCPVALILDCSGSMHGPPISELNQALPGLFQELLVHDLTAARVEPCLITCGGDAKVALPFTPLQDLATYQSRLVAGGETPLGKAINLALAEIEARTAHCRDQGIACYTPAVVVLSDGRPTDLEFLEASAKLGTLARERNWTIIAVGIGPRADLKALEAITAPGLPPVRLEGLNFAALFQWVSVSLQAMASASPDPVHPPVSAT